MSFHVGNSFKETSRWHLYFIVAQIQKYYVAFPLATFSKEVVGDDACVLQPNEHHFIRFRSYVAYGQGIVHTEEELETMLKNQQIRKTNEPDASEELVKKILDRAHHSRFIKQAVLRLVDTEYLKKTDVKG